MPAGISMAMSPRAASSTGMPTSGAGGSGAAGIVGGVGKIYGMFADAAEFNRQVGFQQLLLTNTAEMVIGQRDSLIYDTNVRERVVKGSIIARSGKAGVSSSSGSIINAAADVAATAAVDRLRIWQNAQNQVNVLEAQKAELGRQRKLKTQSAFIGAAFEVGSMLAGGGK